ncbi:RNA pseudouridylate synthase domain-containing protein 1 [Geranomyces variabilis]|nr:RNA pseudouridylate synthase domain-containing protein 1 [Geranomyces variabilis]
MVTDELTAPHSEVPVQDTLQSKASVQSLKSGEQSSASNVENHSEEETEIPAQISEHDNATLATCNDNNVAKPQNDGENCLRSAEDAANLTESLSSSASGLSPAPVPPISISGFDPRYNRPYEIDILYYQPDTYLVTNKPWDVRIDGNTSKCPTVESLLNARFPEHEKLYLLHQLDYVTSGVHVWGLNSAATGAAGKLFVSRDVRKTYSALVKGHVEQDSFVINQALVDNPNDPQKRVYVASDEQPGKACETHVEVLRRGYFHHAPVTHVKLSPVTGRRHQLRVHMQSIGHPIVGDYAYENPITEHAFRTMLHAWKLELPLDKAAPLRFEAPEPFADLVRDAPMDRPDLPKRAAHIEYEDAAETSSPESTTESIPATTEEASPLVMNVEQAAVETAAFAGVPVPDYEFENELSAIQPADVVPDANESAAKSLATVEPAQPTEAEQVATNVEHQVARESQLKDEPIAQVPMILSVEEVQQASTEQLDSEQGREIASLPEYSGEANATAVASDFVGRAATDVHHVAVTPNETLVSLAEEIPVRAIMTPTVESSVHDHAAAEDLTSDVAEDTIENATVSADVEKPQPASVVVLDLEQVASDGTGQVANLPRFTLEDEVEAVQSDLDPSDAPSADDIKEVPAVEQEGEIQPHAAHEAVLPHLVTVQGVENDVDAIGEYGLEDEVVAVCSDYQEENGVTAVPPVKASESGTVAAENQDVVQPHHHEDEQHVESQVFAMSDIKDGQTSQFLAEHVSNETPAYSLEEEVSAVCTDFAEAKPAATPARGIPAEEVAAKPETAVDQQSTVDEHLQLSYAYEQKWHDAATIAKSAAASVTDSITEAVHKVQETVAPVVQDTVADLSDKAEDAAAAVTDKAVDMVESAQAAVATVSESEAPFDSEAAQKTIDEHLNLSYAYEQSWNVPREEPAASTFENTVAELTDKAQDAVASVKDKAAEMVQSAQAAVTTASEPEAQLDSEEAQKTIDEHLNLSYAYEQSWSVPREEPAASTFENTVAELSDKAQDAVVAVKDKAAEMVESAQAAITTTGTETEAPFNAEEAQKTIDEHLNLSYAYEESWNVPREEPVAPAVVAELGEKVENAVTAVKDKAAELVESAQAAVANVSETVEDNIKERSATPEPVAVVAGDRSATPEPVTLTTSSLPAQGSVTPAKRSSEQVFEEPAIVPAKRGAEDVVPSAQLPSKKIATAEAVEEDKPNASLGVASVDKLVFEDEPHVIAPVESATKPAIETREVAPAAEPVHQEVDRSVEPIVAAEPAFHIALPSQEAHHTESLPQILKSVVEAIAPASEPVHEEATRSIEPAVDASPSVAEPAHDETPVSEPVHEESAHSMDASVAEPAISVVPVSEQVASVSEPVHEESTAGDEPARAIEPVVDEPANVAKPALNAHVSDEAAPVHEESARSIEPAVDELASMAEPAVDVASVSEEAAPVLEPVHEESARSVEPTVEELASVAEPAVDVASVSEEAAPVLEPVHEESARSVEPAVEELASVAQPAVDEEAAPVSEPIHEEARFVEPAVGESASVAEPALYVAPVSEEVAPVSEPVESEPAHAEPAHDFASAAEPAADEEVARFVEPAADESVSVAEPAVHEEAARSAESALDEPISVEEYPVHNHEDAARSVEPAVDESAGAAEPAFPLATISEEAATEVPEPVHEEATQSVEPVIESATAPAPEETAPVSEISKPAVPVSDEVAPVSEILEPVHEEAARSIEPAVESVSAEEPAHHVAPASALKETAVSEVPEPAVPAGEEVAPVLDIPGPVESTNTAEPAYPLAPISEEAAPVLAIAEPVDEEAVRSIEPAVVGAAVDEPASQEAAPISAMSEPVHEQAVRSVAPTLKETENDATGLELVHEQVEPAAVTASTPPTADVSKDATAAADFIAAEKNDASAAEVVGSASSVDERNVLPAGAPVSGESIQAPATAHVGVESPVHPIPIVATPIASDSAVDTPAPVTPESAQQSEATKKAQKGWCSIM